MWKLYSVLLFGLCLLAQKSPLTHESMWLLKRVGAPSASPDGKWVVYSVTEPAYEAKEQSSDLWMLPSEGGTPRRLTHTKGSEGNPVWSPDSQKLAFTATREGDSDPQIYVLDLQGGEAQRICSVEGGASEAKWSPDGRRLLFTAKVGGGVARKSNARIYESYPIRHWDRWLDEKKTHIFVVDAVAGSTPKDILADSNWAKSASTGGPLSNAGEDLSPIWTPDSRSIVFQSDLNRNEAAYKIGITKIFLVSADGGEPKPLSSGQYSYSSPKFRPDGRALYMLESREGVNDVTYSISRLAMIPWPEGGIPKTLAPDMDRSIGDFVFLEGSKRILFSFEHAGLGKLGALDYAGGNFLEHPQKQGNYANLSVGGNHLFANYDSATAPAEIVRLDFAKAQLKTLTDHNSVSLAKLDLPELRHFWFTSKKGRMIHNLLALPPGFDAKQKYPLLVLIHGGPHGMWKDQFFLRWNYHLIAAPGYIVLMTNYTGSTGFGEKFAQNIQRDPLATPGEELNEAADEAIKLFSFIDSGKQCAGGASYGGHLANWLQATTTRYRCLISHAGLINLESQYATSDVSYSRELNNGGPVWLQGEIWKQQNPIRYAEKFRTPTLVTVGERDFRVPLNNSLEYWTILQRLRIPSRLIVFPDANHWILKGEDSRLFYQELHTWLKRWLQ